MYADVNAIEGRDVSEIFGYPEISSSAVEDVVSRVSNDNRVFEEALQIFDGAPDALTIEKLGD